MSITSEGKMIEFNEPKVSIQKKKNSFVSGFFDGLDCIREFKTYSSEGDILKEADEFFGVGKYTITRPVITTIRMSGGRR